MSDETIFIVLIAIDVFVPSLFIWGICKCIWSLRNENQVIAELADKADIDRDLAHTIYQKYGKSSLYLLDEPEKLENIICRLTDTAVYDKVLRHFADPTSKTLFEEIDAMYKRIGKG